MLLLFCCGDGVAATLKETVGDLKSSGMTNAEIKDMLSAMGYSEADISGALADSGRSDDFDESEEEVVEMPKKKQPVNAETKKEADRAVLASRMAMNVSQSAVDKIDEKMDEINNLRDKISDVHEIVLDQPTTEHIDSLHDKTDALHIRTDELETKIDELNAKIDGLTSLMKKILESQRDILMRMK